MANWATDRADRVVVAVTWIAMGILVWLAWDDLIAWVFGLPVVTL